MSDPTCHDCGAKYLALGVDLVLPDQVWNLLCPEQGILCANCICKRLQKRGATTALLCWPDNFMYDEVAR